MSFLGFMSRSLIFFLIFFFLGRNFYHSSSGGGYLASLRLLVPDFSLLAVFGFRETDNRTCSSTVLNSASLRFAFDVGGWLSQEQPMSTRRPLRLSLIYNFVKSDIAIR